MRINIYAEEMTDKVEIISKEIDGQVYTGVRFYLELPVSRFKFGGPVDVTTPAEHFSDSNGVQQIKGPFIHRPGDDDSSAVTFWGKQSLRHTLRKALQLLEKHYDI